MSSPYSSFYFFLLMFPPFNGGGSPWLMPIVEEGIVDVVKPEPAVAK
jgi:hypothetical protein